MDRGGQYNPRTIEEVFMDFRGRRARMIKALTTGSFLPLLLFYFLKCDPEKENLWLYGYPSEQREVNLPAEEVPPELPEPALGTAKKQVKEKPSNMNSSGKSKSNSRKGRESQAKYSKVAEPKDEDEEGLEEEDEHGDSFVGHVERTTRLMSSGYAATSARNGSMVSASRSPLPGPSTLSNTNARLAATKERNPDGFRWAPSIRKQIFVLLTTRDCLS
ncbi:hypothetical protein MLD38_014707 [Melastoma candidum]|uniref:Uncharacterized protein n=1 Tax=Melastoma candidum TaxID=119954 RepID=A0ACB9RDR4_9MYRT|nr:hypothetical protein MLD38_014707 [Melastoma candidum]